MKPLSYKLSAIVLSVSLVFASSCDSEDDVSSLTPEQAKSTLNSVDAELSATLEEFANAEGISAIESLAGLTGEDDPFGARFTTDTRDLKKNLKNSLAVFRSIFTPKDGAARTKADEPFDFDAKTGVYEWNAAENVWQRTGDSDIIQIFFPTEGSTTNNAEFKLTAYEEKETPNGDEAYSPTAIEAELFIDDDKAASLDLTASYDEADQLEFADITYFLAPFSFEIDYDNTKPTETNFSETLLKDNEVVIGAGITANYASVAKEDPKTVSGYVQLLSIKFEGTVNLEGINNPSPNSDINDFIAFTITIDGATVGTIVWVVEDDDSIPYVEYTDGSTQALEDIFESLVEILSEFDLG